MCGYRWHSPVGVRTRGFPSVDLSPHRPLPSQPGAAAPAAFRRDETVAFHANENRRQIQVCVPPTDVSKVYRCLRNKRPSQVTVARQGDSPPGTPYFNVGEESAGALQKWAFISQRFALPAAEVGGQH